MAAVADSGGLGAGHGRGGCAGEEVATVVGSVQLLGGRAWGWGGGQQVAAVAYCRGLGACYCNRTTCKAQSLHHKEQTASQTTDCDTNRL